MSGAIVLSLPRTGHVPGQSHRRLTLRKRKEREILLACLEENQRALSYYSAQAAHCSRRIAELLADLRKLDGYRALDWGDDPRPVKERV
jgi:hypothetical protein